MEELQIRKAKDEDRSEINSVHAQAIRNVHHERYSPEQLEEWIVTQGADYKKPIEGRHIYVALIASRIVAFGHVAKKSSNNSQYELKALFVHPSYSRQGVGKKLYKFIEDIAISLGSRSMVVEASFNGEVFYQANGFVSGEIGYVSGSVLNSQIVNMAKQLNRV